MTRVFIVASSSDMRERLRRLLDFPDLQVAGEGVDLTGMDAIGRADVLVLGDERLLDESPLDTEVVPQAVVVVAAFGSSAVVSQLSSLELKGWAVVPPHADSGEMRAAVLAAEAGFAAIPADSMPDSWPIPADPGFRGIAGGAADGPEEEAEVVEESLTGRERQVLELLAHGLSNRDIAARLGISEHTAKFHVASVLAKLGAPNRADAVRRGIRRGLVAL